MKTNNYNEYDKLVLYVKKDKVESIVKHYILFGWCVESQEDNDRYEDIVDITFYRPHKIENKDELQLLQVHMEERINKLAEIDKHKNSLTTALGLCLGTFIITLMTFGFLGVANVLEKISLLWILVLFATSLVLIVIEVLFLPKIYKQEIKKHKFDHDKIEAEINEVCDRVVILTGGAYEK